MARALLIIDFQNDFTAGGALAVPDGDAIAGLAKGFRVTIDRGGIRGIDVEPGDSERALAELQAAGATLA